MDKQIELLNLVHKIVLFSNEIYKIFKLSRIYIYGFKYIKQKALIVRDDILTYTFGKQHIYSSFKNQLDNKPTKILVSIFNKYTVLNNEIDIENIFTFSNGSQYNNDQTQDKFVFYTGLKYNYKDNIFYKNSEYLTFLYDMRLLIRSITAININTDCYIYYYNEKNKKI